MLMKFVRLTCSQQATPLVWSHEPSRRNDWEQCDPLQLAGRDAHPVKKAAVDRLTTEDEVMHGPVPARPARHPIGDEKAGHVGQCNMCET